MNTSAIPRGQGLLGNFPNAVLKKSRFKIVFGKLHRFEDHKCEQRRGVLSDSFSLETFSQTNEIIKTTTARMTPNIYITTEEC